MNARQLFDALNAATTSREVEAALAEYERTNAERVGWTPVGDRPNNRGIIEVSADPGRALVERVTNAVDAALEAEHQRRNGRPECRSPKEAASAWFNVPEGGLSELTPAQRRALANRVTVTLLPGDGREARVVVVRDTGIGLTPAEMPQTILSLNASNKIRKHYLAGTYGQGGSATFAVSDYTFIASRPEGQNTVGFTVVKFLDLPAEEYKTGHYVYLTTEGAVTEADATGLDFEQGTLARHIGYDLSRYASPLGPGSIYGLLNEVLFDPVLPVWLNSELHGYRRVIKGSRNALNGAVDEGDADRRGPRLDHRVRLYYVTLGDFGRIGFEYWVLERPTRENRKPSAAYANPSRPILLTLNGQTHAELSQVLIRKAAELPHLTQRLICHIDCNYLTADAKRALFVSNREDARRGIVYETIEQELVRVLKSDDELKRLNAEAREQRAHEQDEEVRQQMRREVARLLRIQGMPVGEDVGAELGGGGQTEDRPRPEPRPRPAPPPIELHEPPTFIRIVWPADESVELYAGQRRYLRVETDANSTYHDANHPDRSRTNLVVTGEGIRLVGSTPLQGGRLRLILEALPNVPLGAVGNIRVELSRPGLPVLADERLTIIIERPPAHEGRRRTTLPPFDVVPVDGPDDPQWASQGWPDDPRDVAFSWEMEAGEMIVYYSTVFPKFVARLQNLEQRNPALAESFRTRYGIWLAVHSFLALEDERQGEQSQPVRQQAEEDAEAVEVRDRKERTRVATLAALFAAREVQIPVAAEEAE